MHVSVKGAYAQGIATFSTHCWIYCMVCLRGLCLVELALCVGEMNQLKYSTLEYLNTKVCSFSYQHSDRFDKTQPMPKKSAAKLSISGSRYGNLGSAKK